MRANRQKYSLDFKSLMGTRAARIEHKEKERPQEVGGKMGRMTKSSPSPSTIWQSEH